jgi:hypothetical protein
VLAVVNAGASGGQRRDRVRRHLVDLRAEVAGTDEHTVRAQRTLTSQVRGPTHSAPVTWW